jgi:AraC family transcriptional regulator
MTPGAVLLGERGRCFACGHEHGEGDCVSFQFGPALLERIAADAAAAARALAEPQTAEEIVLALAGLALRVDGKAPLPQVRARPRARGGGGASHGV